MKEIANRWYFSLFFAPILINLFSDFLSLPSPFNNWLYTLVACQTIIIATLIIELVRNSQDKNKSLLANDVEKITELLNIIDIDSFQEHISNQDSWNGYKKSAVHNMIDFTYDVKLLKYRLGNKNLKSMLLKLESKMNELTELGSTHLYGTNHDFYAPAKENDIVYKRSSEVCPKLNSLSRECENILTDIVDYCTKKGFILNLKTKELE